MSKIMVTGASGHLGGGIIHHLLEKGTSPSDIIALVRSEQSAKRLQDLNINIKVASYDDISSLESAFEGVEKLMFVSSPDFDNTLRIQQHANVVLAARNAKVAHIVYTGISFAETMNVAGLQYVHLATENMIKTTDIPYTFLRNGFYLENIIGGISSAALKSGKLITATKDAKFNFVLRDDLALAAAVVLSEDGHENKTYDLVNTTSTSFDEFASILSGVYEKEIVHQPLSPDEALKELVAEGAIEGIAAFNVYGLYLPIQQGQFSQTSNVLEQLIKKKLTTVSEAVNLLK